VTTSMEWRVWYISQPKTRCSCAVALDANPPSHLRNPMSHFPGIIHAFITIHLPPIYIILPNAGIRVCASQKEKTSLGPVMSSLGVRPLKNEVMPSCFIMLETILKPLSGFSKFLFWIRVLMTSRGADTTSEALAPAMEATKFCDHEAVL
jgi:hypothetical protein